MIRTINERLRTNKRVVVERAKKGISNLFCMEIRKVIVGETAFEKYIGRKANMLKSAMIKKCILEKHQQIEIEPKDFSKEADSTILVRQRGRGKKLEGAFKKVEGTIAGQSENTLTVLHFAKSRRESHCVQKRCGN